MLRLLIDPLASTIEMALAEHDQIINTSSAEDDDKALALETAYQALKIKRLDEVVMVNGPGNFTRLRVALGFVRGLGVGFQIPTRGIGIFEIDHALLKPCPDQAVLYRDARGGRFYEARFDGATLLGIELVREMHVDGYSAENIEHVKRINGDEDARREAFARLAQSAHGETPARANYVRPPDAALPKEAPLIILDA